MTRSEGGEYFLNRASYLAASSLAGLVSLFVPLIALEVAARTLGAALGLEWAFYLKSLFGETTAFSLACGAAAAGQFLAAARFPALAGNGLEAFVSVLPGPLLGALFFHEASRNYFFGMYKLAWLPVLLCALLGALAAPNRRLRVQPRG